MSGTLAVSPSLTALENAPRLIPDTAPAVMLAPLTTLSASLAVSAKLRVEPCATETLARQFVIMGWFTAPPLGVPVTLILSMPTHSSLPTALAVIMRNWSKG